MRNMTFGELFDFERRFAFSENGDGDDDTGIRGEPPCAGGQDEDGDPFDCPASSSSECPFCAMLDGDDGIVGGYFDEDGKRIDPELIPVPSLCVCCGKRDSESWEVDVFCTLNRIDQKTGDGFVCDAFEPV